MVDDTALQRVNNAENIRKALFMSRDELHAMTSGKEYARLTQVVTPSNIDEQEELLNRIIDESLPDVESGPTGPGVV